MPAYTVEKEGSACEACGHGNTWLVVAPDGAALSGTYHDEADAHEMAEALNGAYQAGIGMYYGKVADDLNRLRNLEAAADSLLEALANVVNEPSFTLTVHAKQYEDARDQLRAFLLRS